MRYYTSSLNSLIIFFRKLYSCHVNIIIKNEAGLALFKKGSLRHIVEVIKLDVFKLFLI